MAPGVIAAGMVAAGVGCRRDCSAAAIARLVREAGRRAGRMPTVLAAPDFKRDEAGVRDAAARLGLTLVLIPDAALRAAQSRCVTGSTAALRATGLASVAEAAALAAAGPGAALLLARIAAEGATCALAGAARP
jgi:cobalt-precorrin 5A hydrolase